MGLIFLAVLYRKYAIFVDTARKYALKSPQNPRKALVQAVDECIQNNVLKDLLISQKSEVLESMLTTFNKELYEKNLREQAIAEGLAEGRAQGRATLLTDLVQKKLAKNMSIPAIAEALEQPEDVILSIIEQIKKAQ